MRDVVFRDAVTQDIPWLVDRHDAIYRSEAGFDKTFASVVQTALKTYFAQRDPQQERAFVPMANGDPVGSLFVTRGDATGVAQIRLFWLEPPWRGKGLAQEMLAQAIDHARGVGCREIHVRTYDRHVAAGRLYASTGFHLTSAHPVIAYGQELTEQAWRREL